MDQTNKVLVGLITFCIFILGAFLILKSFKLYEAQNEPPTVERVSLASLNYTSEIKGEINGGFFLGTGCVNGVIEEEQYYVAYKVLEDGGKKLWKIPANITTIYDTLQTNCEAYAEVTSNYFGIISINLYVPEGTILQDYDLSLE